MRESSQSEQSNTQSNLKKTDETNPQLSHFNDALIIGQQLSAARINKNKSVDEVARQLKVTQLKIILIEEGKLSELPDRVFAIGLLRSYAKLLNINICALIEKMKINSLWQEPNLPTQTINRQLSRQAYVRLTWGTRRVGYNKFWWMIIIFLVTSIIIAVIWKINASDKNWLPRWYKNNINSSADQSVHVVSDVNNTFNSNVDIDKLPKTNESELNTSQIINTENSTLDTSPSESSQATVSSKVGQAVNEALPTNLSPTNVSLTNPNVISGQNNSAQTNALNFKTRDDTWVSVTTLDNKIIFSGIISANSDKNISVQKPVKLTIGKIAGISQLLDNGNPIDVQTFAKKSSQVVHLTLN